jgi:hypothetical protein
MIAPLTAVAITLGNFRLENHDEVVPFNNPSGSADDRARIVGANTWDRVAGS